MRRRYNNFYINIIGVVVLLCLIAPIRSQGQAIRVMAYNIHHGCDIHERLQLKQVADLIRSDKSDIVGLVEVDSVCRRSNKTDQAAILGKMTGMHSAFVRHFPFQGGAYGLAILSRFPIIDVVNKRVPVMTNENGDTTRALLVARIKLPHHRHLSVVVAHLDYRTEASRLRQAAFLTGLLKNEQQPVMILGDLNASPDSKAIQMLKSHFIDANHAEARTFPSDTPREKIDYIMIDRANFIKTLKDTVYPVKFSDHRPIVAEVMISDK